MARNIEAERYQSSVLYEAFVGVGAKHNMRRAAATMGISYQQLDDYCTGRSNLPIYRLPSLWAATHDLELMSELTRLGDVGVVFCEAARGETTSDDSRGSALKVGSEAGKVAQLVVDAESDGLVTETERKAIEAQILGLERQAEQLRQIITARPVRVVGGSR